MDVETIKAIGEYIVMPICAFGAMGIFFYCFFRD